MAGVPAFLAPNTQQQGPQGLQQYLQQLGEKALASGAISQEEAQKNLDEAQSGISMAAPKGSGAMSMAAPPGIGPGRKASNTKMTSERDTSTQTKNLTKSAQEYADQMELVRNSPEFQSMQQGDQALQNQISMTRAHRLPENYMVKPLLAFVDSQTGSNLSKGFSEGPTRGDINAQLLKYQDELAKRKQDSFKAMMSGISSLKNGQQTNGTININSATDMKGFGGAGTNTGVQNFDKWYKTLQADKGIDKANTAVDGAAEVARHLAAGGSVNAMQAQVSMLRAAGLNRITNVELANTVGNKAIADRISQALETISSGDLTEANKAQYLSAAKAISENAPAILATLRNQHERSATMYGFDPADPRMKALLDAKFQRIMPGGLPATAPAAKKARADMTDAELDAELAKHGG